MTRIQVMISSLSATDSRAAGEPEAQALAGTYPTVTRTR
jgi:hypothetical protein